MLGGCGALGVWNAQRDVFPTSKRQRCWVHKMRNVVDKVSDRDQGDVSALLHEMYTYPSPQQTKALIQQFRQRYYKQYPKAVECLEDGSAMLLTYFQFPKRHWRSIKSTNVIESMFATVKLRTNAARRIPRRESALYLVFKLLTTLQARLHKIHGYRLVALTIDLLRQRKHAKLRLFSLFFFHKYLLYLLIGRRNTHSAYSRCYCRNRKLHNWCNARSFRRKFHDEVCSRQAIGYYR